MGLNHGGKTIIEEGHRPGFMLNSHMDPSLLVKVRMRRRALTVPMDQARTLEATIHNQDDSDDQGYLKEF